MAFLKSYDFHGFQGSPVPEMEWTPRTPELRYGWPYIALQHGFPGLDEHFAELYERHSEPDINGFDRGLNTFWEDRHKDERAIGESGYFIMEEDIDDAYHYAQSALGWQRWSRPKREDVTVVDAQLLTELRDLAEYFPAYTPDPFDVESRGEPNVSIPVIPLGGFSVYRFNSEPIPWELIDVDVAGVNIFVTDDSTFDLKGVPVSIGTHVNNNRKGVFIVASPVAGFGSPQQHSPIGVVSNRGQIQWISNTTTKVYQHVNFYLTGQDQEDGTVSVKGSRVPVPLWETFFGDG